MFEPHSVQPSSIRVVWPILPCIKATTVWSINSVRFIEFFREITGTHVGIMVKAEAGIEVHLQEGLRLVWLTNVFVWPYGREDLVQGHAVVFPLWVVERGR